MEQLLIHVGIALAGLVAGFINTLAGGGSLLTLPALMLLGLPVDVANGTNRVGIVTQSAVASWGFSQAGHLSWRRALQISLPTWLGAGLGAWAAASLPVPILKPVVLFTLVMMATFLAFRPQWVMGEEGSSPVALSARPSAVLGLFLAGVYGGFVQAGVGFVLLSVLGGLLDEGLVRANALKSVATLSFGLVALGVFLQAGLVAWGPALLLAGTTPIGSWLAVRFALSVRQEVLRRLLLVAVVLSVLAVWNR